MSTPDEVDVQAGAEEFGPYRMVELIGRGGMGEVWRAIDSSHDDRVVALKLLGRWLSDDPAFARRFRRESALAAKLRNPHMVSVHRYGAVEGRLFIDMQLVDGTDLGTLLDTNGPLEPARAVEIIAQTSKALDTAHNAGLLHRDIKPSNILITNDSGDDHVYLIDFGIARTVTDTRISVSEAVIGTLAYMAPERFAGEGDHRADIYALGCVLHQALTGDTPFTATNPLVLLNAHQNLPPPPPSTLRAGVPTGMDAVVAKALAKNPAERYQSASELAQAARQALTTAASAPVTVIAPPPATGPYAGQPWPSEVVASTRHSNPGVAQFPQPGASAYSGPGATPYSNPGAGGAAQPYAGPWIPPAVTPAPGGYGPQPYQPPPPRSIAKLIIAAIAAVAVVAAVVITVVLVNRPGTDAIIDPATSTVAQPPPDPNAPIPEHELVGHAGSVAAVTTAQLDGRTVVISAGDDGSIRVWDIITGEPVGSPITGHTDYVVALATAELGGRPVLVSGSRDTTIKIWDLASHQQIGSDMVGHSGSVTALTTAQFDGSPVVVSGAVDHTLRVWDLATRTQIGSEITGHTDSVSAVTVTDLAGRPVIISASYDGTMRAWDLGSHRPYGNAFTGHTDDVLALTTGQLVGRPYPVVVSGSADRTVRVWDLATQTQIGAEIAWHTDSVRAVTVTQFDGDPVIISASNDQHLGVWDLACGCQVTELSGHTDWVLAVAATQVNSRPVVVSASSDSTVRTWDLLNNV